MKRLGIVFLVCLVVLPWSALAGPPKSLEQTLQAEGRFSTYLALRQVAGLSKARPSKSPRTFLVPNDAAFAAVPAAELERLKSDPARARAYLDMLTLQGKVSARDLADATPGRGRRHLTAQGSTLVISNGADAAAAEPAPVAVPAPTTAGSGNDLLIETPTIPNITPPPAPTPPPEQTTTAAPPPLLDLSIEFSEPIMIQIVPTPSTETPGLDVTGLPATSQFTSVRIVPSSSDGPVNELSSSLIQIFDLSN